MDVCYTLNEGIALSDKLLARLNEDQDEIRGCLKGELLDEYLKVSDLAEEKVKSIQGRLIQLQMEERELQLLRLSQQ